MCARWPSGRCDVALVPVAALLDHPEWEVVPEVAIACRGAVQTVLVVADARSSSSTRIFLDAASRSSALLLRVLLQRAGTGARAGRSRPTATGSRARAAIATARW